MLWFSILMIGPKYRCHSPGKSMFQKTLPAPCLIYSDIVPVSRRVVRTSRGLSAISRALVQTFRGLVRIFRALVQTFRGHVRTFRGLVQIFRALVRIFRALVKIFRGLVRIFRALVQIFRGLVKIFRALVQTSRGLLKISREALTVYSAVSAGWNSIVSNVMKAVPIYRATTFKKSIINKENEHVRFSTGKLTVLYGAFAHRIEFI